MNLAKKQKRLKKEFGKHIVEERRCRWRHRVSHLMKRELKFYQIESHSCKNELTG